MIHKIAVTKDKKSNKFKVTVSRSKSSTAGWQPVVNSRATYTSGKQALDAGRQVVKKDRDNIGNQSE